METPRGWYGEEERTKPVVLKRDRSKSNIISLHRPTSLHPSTGATTTTCKNPVRQGRSRIPHEITPGVKRQRAKPNTAEAKPNTTPDHAGCEEIQGEAEYHQGEAGYRRATPKTTLPVEQHGLARQDLDIQHP